MKNILINIKKYFLNTLKVFFYYYSFLISLFSLLHLLIFNNFKNKIVFLQPEGGFGHTILSPEVLRRLYKENEWVIINAYEPSRHNFLTRELYEKNFYWLRLTISIFNKSIIKDEFKFKIFSILESYLKKNNIEHYYFGDFIHKYNGFDSKKLNPLYSKEGLPFNEYNSIRILKKKNEFDLPHQSSKKVKNILINLGKRKVCGFAYKEYKPFSLGENKILKKNLNYSYDDDNATYISDNVNKKISTVQNNLKDKYRNHLFRNARSTDNLESYKKSFFNIINKGWDIYIYGDPISSIPTWFDEIKKNIYFLKNNFRKDQFNLKVGLIADCLIGPSSGASAWRYAFHTKPQLIIDSYPIGWIFYNALNAYKFIEHHYQQKKINEVINDQVYFFRQPPFEYRSALEEEKNAIIMDFINNLDNLESIAMKPVDLNLNPDHPIIWSKTTVSKKWYEIQEKFL